MTVLDAHSLRYPDHQPHSRKYDCPQMMLEMVAANVNNTSTHAIPDSILFEWSQDVRNVGSGSFFIKWNPFLQPYTYLVFLDHYYSCSFDIRCFAFLRLDRVTEQAAFPTHTIALTSELARLMPHRQIARLLNRIGVETSYGNAWTLERVRGFRKHHEIAVYRDGEWAERGKITFEAAAKIVGVCTAQHMLRRGDIEGMQVCRGAPWRSRPWITNPEQRVYFQ